MSSDEDQNAIPTPDGAENDSPVRATGRSLNGAGKQSAESGDEANIDTPVSDGNEDDLFGDDGDGDDADKSGEQRKLDDKELDSGDDEGRKDRVAETIEDEDYVGQQGPETFNIIDVDIGRHPQPVPGDGELYLLNFPHFLGIEAEDFNPKTYHPPDKPHGGEEAGEDFSGFSVASTSICWRYDPKDDQKLQSNSRIIRWSDGSLTLQFASAPKEQYKISAKALRPPMFTTSKKPMPTTSYKGRNAAHANEYDPDLDAHLYLAAPHIKSSVFRIVAPVSAALSVLPSGTEDDRAVRQLEKAFAAAGAGGEFGGINKFEVTEDPELARKRAELAEKEKSRMLRRQIAAKERETDRQNRVLGHGGSRSGGLTVGGLEDDLLGGTGGPRTTKARAKPKRKPNRRGEIYSDEEEDYGRRGRTREDEYEADDFLVDDENEEEVGSEADAEGDEDIDDLAIDGQEPEAEESEVEEKQPPPAPAAARKQREREETPKRKSVEEEDVAVEGSPGQARKKHRYVVDDEDDE